MDSIDEILNKLENQTNVSKEELLDRVNRKYEELSGLITKEGAAYIVARELGVNLPNNARRRLQIKNIMPGMKNVNVVGRVFKLSPINEFQRQDGTKGRVVNVFIGDETGQIRLPLWNEQVDFIDNGGLQLGSAVQIVNGLAKENVFGNVELTLGRFGSMRQIDDSDEIPSVDELNKKFYSFLPERTTIDNLTQGNFEIRATIVDVFKGNFIFNTCQLCNSSVKENNGKFFCGEHGEIEPNPELVLSCIADDGTGNLRVVLFRNLAASLCGINPEELKKQTTEERFKTIREKLLGREMIFKGNVKRNKLSNRLELMVNEFKDLNVLEESKRLAEELEVKVG